MAIRTTQELASWALGESPSSRTGATSSSGLQGPSLSDTELAGRNKDGSIFSDSEQGEYRDSIDSSRPEVIEEVSESVSPEEHDDQLPKLKPQISAPSYIIQHPPSKTRNYLTAQPDIDRPSSPSILEDGVDVGEVTESTSLLPRPRLIEPPKNRKTDIVYTERHWVRRKGRWATFRYELARAWGTTTSPSQWNLRHASSMVIGALAAVFLGLLLNVLDALSYGTIIISNPNLAVWETKIFF
jgi:SulP family sulfate permease